MKTIDLSGPEGNVHSLAGIAQTWNKQLGNKRPSLLEEAENREDCHGYDVVLGIFDEWFKHIDYEFINDPRNTDSIEEYDD